MPIKIYRKMLTMGTGQAFCPSYKDDYLGALRQPAAIASDSLQNHLSPCLA
ncbi:MAG: hypothetical protein F6K04_02850 [Leptolyngbya sp. SIO4C5]|nr:hypothetical protein [Leptolyngbya sp. SIO4C5]